MPKARMKREDLRIQSQRKFDFCFPAEKSRVVYCTALFVLTFLFLDSIIMVIIIL